MLTLRATLTITLVTSLLSEGSPSVMTICGMDRISLLADQPTRSSHQIERLDVFVCRNVLALSSQYLVVLQEIGVVAKNSTDRFARASRASDPMQPHMVQLPTHGVRPDGLTWLKRDSTEAASCKRPSQSFVRPNSLASLSSPARPYCHS